MESGAAAVAADPTWRDSSVTGKSNRQSYWYKEEVTSQVGFCHPLTVRSCVHRPRDGHYFPDLHHLRYEVEEGTTADGRAVRFGYEQQDFPGFSWRGYAQMSPIQV